VKTTVRRVIVFTTTVVAHFKRLHGGVRTIIGEGFDNGKTGTAIRAVGERIEIPSIGRIEDFTQTVIAYGDIGQDESRLLTTQLTLTDDKSLKPHRVKKAGLQSLDRRTGGLFRLQAQKKMFQREPCPLDLYYHSLCRIHHPPV